ncbi:MAG: UDP-N-acetylmuramoyl-L-alanine--D-glutamate ligase [Nitrospinae bacterium]|nr:UDP-N-acetylmuramoyl-L-alanine--D-glutamate ligase [Nitrospinota bacterium]
MLLDNLKDKRVIVVGFGRSGVSAANLLYSRGAVVSVTDSRGEGDLGSGLSLLKGNPKLFLGGHDGIDISLFNLAVVSPGVPWDSEFLVSLRDAGIKVISELELASYYTDKPIIAITGTNGKTTTSTLVRDMLVAGGKRVFLGGNIGVPLSEYIIGGEEVDYLVCEVSTFQMEGADLFHPYISTILNITEDHLDRHADMDEYITLKKRVYLNQGEGDFFLLNLDDPIVSSLDTPPFVTKHSFSRTTTTIANGAFQSGDELFLSDGGVPHTLCNIEKLKIKGVHNVENVLAAAAIAYICGVSVEDIRRAAVSFKGIKNRMEFVDAIDGITFINDSKGTNVGAAVRSIESIDTPLILIAGGKDKGGDYTPLKEAIERKVKEVVLIGEASDRISSFLPKTVSQTMASSLQEAVEIGYKRGKEGDTVLLSPACSSFDMFKSYEDRGNHFREAVKAIREGRGNNE